MRIPAKYAGILSTLAGRAQVRRAGDEYRTRCPGHDDDGPSLCLRLSPDGRCVLLKCKAGCTAEQIVAGIGKVISDLFLDDDTLVEVDDDFNVVGHAPVPPDHPPPPESPPGGAVEGPVGTTASGDADPDLRHRVYEHLLALLPLSDEHRQDLRRRGLDDADIDRNGYRTLERFALNQAVGQIKQGFDDATLLGIPGFRRDRGRVRFMDIEGLLVPVRDLEGRLIALKVRQGGGGSGPEYLWVSSAGDGGPGGNETTHSDVMRKRAISSNNDRPRTPKRPAKTPLRTVTATDPCPICRGDHKCSIGKDGLILCGRSDGDVPGFKCLGPARRDPRFSLYRAEGHDPSARGVSAEDDTPNALSVDWDSQAVKYQEQLTQQLHQELADRLGVPDLSERIFRGFRVGWDLDSRSWTVPERNGDGRVVGINRRFRGGEKRMIAGSQRGLYYAPDWESGNGPIFCPEGFSDTAVLTAMGLSAVGRPSNTGGVEYLAELLERLPAARVVIVLGEHDPKPDGQWPGKDGAISTAEGLARRLDRPVLYAFPPGNDKDVRSWVLARTPDPKEGGALESLGDRFQKLVQSDVQEVLLWEEPISFGEFVLPPFPVGALASWQRDFVDAVSVSTQTPADLGGMLCLAATAVPCAKRITVHVGADHVEPVNIFIAVALPPATRKSRVFVAMTDPIAEVERERVKAMQPEVAAARSVRAIEEKMLEDLQKKAAKAEGTARDTALVAAKELAEKLGVAQLPIVPRLLADDTTPERLAGLMAEHRGRMAVLDAEGGIFDVMRGRYRSSRQTMNIDVFLKSHCGDAIRVDRQGRPPHFIPRPALTMGLAVQTEIIRGLADNQAFRGRGLLARFLFSLPRSPVGHRQVDPPSVPPEVRERYRNGMRALLALEPAIDQHGDAVEHVIQLSPLARQRWLEFARWLEPQLAEHGALGYIADWAGKLAGAAARIAGLLHAADLCHCNDWWNRPIPGETMDRALRIAKYLVPHARAAFHVMGCDPKIGDAQHVLGWIRKHGADAFSKRACFEATKGRFKRVEALDPALDLLISHHHIRERLTFRRGGPGRPASPLYDVNPATLQIVAPEPACIPSAHVDVATDGEPPQDDGPEDLAGSVDLHSANCASSTTGIGISQSTPQASSAVRASVADVQAPTSDMSGGEPVAPGGEQASPSGGSITSNPPEDPGCTPGAGPGDHDTGGDGVTPARSDTGGVTAAHADDLPAAIEYEEGEL
jgi:hypothetical protein